MHFESKIKQLISKHFFIEAVSYFKCFFVTL